MRFPLLVLTLVLAGCATNGGGGGGGTTTTPATSQSTACDPPAASPDAAWVAQRPRVLLNTTQGDITLALDEERAPVTVSNFLNRTRAGFYDGKSFYRVVPGFVIQGGAQQSSEPKIRDEFNPTLRHDAAGILSMATAGPDTGASEFFITLDKTPTLDDRHAVFGRVADGMSAARAIGSLTPAGQPQYDGAPTTTVTIRNASVVDPETFDAAHAVALHPVIAQKKAEAGRAVTFAVVLKNDGSVRDAIGLKATVPAGWTCSVDVLNAPAGASGSSPQAAAARPVVPAGTARVVFLKITPAAGATGTTDVPLTAVSAWSGTPEAAASVKVQIATLGAQVKQGDKITANYAGFLPDGRLFDSSMEAVAKDPAMPKLNTKNGFQDRGSYSTFPFTVGSGVIPGFTNLAKTAKEGETVTMPIPAKDAYATGDMYSRPLTGRDLVFELEIVKIG